MSRHSIVALVPICLVAWLAASSPAALGAPARTEIPVSGIEVPGLATFDERITQLMENYDIPAAAVAVAKDDRLVLARGYGFADGPEGVQPDSLFRLASLSKPITAAAILRLVDDGRLGLDTPLIATGAVEWPARTGRPDPRFPRITIRQLLQHVAGWDRDLTGDAMNPPYSTRAAEALHEPLPGGCATVLRYMSSQPLDFDPGTRYAYSNLGYCALGRVIEAVTGQTYEEAVRTLVLEPASVTRIRIGRTRPEQRAPGEVRYADYPGARLVASVFPDVRGQVPAPYGGLYIEGRQPNGGWISSAADYLRFVIALDGRRPPALLSPESLAQLQARPAAPVSVETATYYGLGWEVRPLAEGANWWHFGSQPGVTTYVVRAANGLTWTVLFASRPRNPSSLDKDVDAAMWAASRQVRDWPTHNLFLDGPAAD